MPGKIINIYELKQRIMEADNILIVSHINPDPDTLGSALGLKWILNKLGKTAGIICETEVTEKNCGCLDIKPELDNIKIKDIKNFDYIIAVDAASLSMLGKSFEKYHDNINLCIDHHYTNSLYARETYLDEKAAAAGEIIYTLAKELNLKIDREFAKSVYCAIAGDSGAFKFSATTPKTMRIAAELLETGFDFVKLNRLIFENKSLEQINIERLAYNCLKLYNQGRIAVINITRELKKEAGLEGVGMEGISGIARTVMGVEAGVLIKEEDEKKLEDKTRREFSISLRSNDYINVAEIAKQFGGGGHMRAAGCTFIAEPDMEDPAGYIEKLLLEKIGSVLI